MCSPLPLTQNALFRLVPGHSGGGQESKVPLVLHVVEAEEGQGAAHPRLQTAQVAAAAAAAFWPTHRPAVNSQVGPYAETQIY